MPSYIGITEVQSNPFAPLTSELVKQLRDNPIAIAEGAAGAPRLYLRAIESLEAGDQIRSRNDTIVGTSEAGSALLNSFEFMQYGTIRAQGELLSGGNSRIRIFRTRNGTGTAVAESDIGVTGVFSADIDVLPGDRIDIFLFSFAGAGSARNGRFSTNGQDLWPGSAARLEGNRSAL